MEKQLLKITDFSGSMNTEDDPSNLQQNESALLSNVIPYGIGYLKLDRSRYCLSVIYSRAPSVTHTGFCCGYSWRDTNGNILLPLIYGLNESISYFSHTASLIGGGTYTYTVGVLTGYATSSTRKLTKNSFISYNGILRIGAYGSSYRPMAFTNFTNNGVTRTRFASAETLQNLNFFNEKVQHTAHPTISLRGCGVYNPVVAKVGADGKYTGGAAWPTYNSHTVGIYAALDGSADSEYVSTDRVWYGISFEYDFTQESPMAACGTDGQPHITYGAGDGGKRVNIDLFVARGTYAGTPENFAQFDERITAIWVWRKINSGSWYRLYKLSVTVGSFACMDDTSTAVTWGNYTGSDLFHLTAVADDLGYTKLDEYIASTGFTDYLVYSVSSSAHTQVGFNPEVDIYWNIGCTLRNYMIVNAQYYKRDSFLYVSNRRLYISKPDQPDVFDPDSWISIDGEEASEFKAIVPLGMERFVVWDSRNCYIINANSSDPRGWYKETQYNVTIGSGNGWATSNYGIFFCNTDGVFLIDNNGLLIEVSRQIKSDWMTNVTASGIQMHFDSTDNVLYLAGNVAGTGGVYGYQYDVIRKAWSRWSGGVILTDKDLVQYCVWIGPGYNSGEVYAMSSLTAGEVISLEAIANEATTGLATDYMSPFYDFGIGEAQKLGRHLWIRYKSTVAITCKVYTNNGTTEVATYTIALSATQTQVKLDIPFRFKNLQVRLTTAANTGVFELYELLFEYKAQRPK